MSKGVSDIPVSRECLNGDAGHGGDGLARSVIL